jgi:hypothetical protein
MVIGVEVTNWFVWACGRLCVPESHLVSCKYLSPGRVGILNFRFPL